MTKKEKMYQICKWNRDCNCPLRNVWNCDGSKKEPDDWIVEKAYLYSKPSQEPQIAPDSKVNRLLDI